MQIALDHCDLGYSEGLHTRRLFIGRLSDGRSPSCPSWKAHSGHSDGHSFRGKPRKEEEKKKKKQVENKNKIEARFGNGGESRGGEGWGYGICAQLRGIRMKPRASSGFIASRAHAVSPHAKKRERERKNEKGKDGIHNTRANSFYILCRAARDKFAAGIFSTAVQLPLLIVREASFESRAEFTRVVAEWKFLPRLLSTLSWVSAWLGDTALFNANSFAYDQPLHSHACVNSLQLVARRFDDFEKELT